MTPRLWVWWVNAIEESTVTFSKSLHDLLYGITPNADVLHHWQSKLKKKKCKWLPSKDGSTQTGREIPCPLDLNSHSKCQQHVSFATCNRMRATVASQDGALLWQHAAVCLLVLFSCPSKFSVLTVSAQVDSAFLGRRKYERVEQLYDRDCVSRFVKLGIRNILWYIFWLSGNLFLENSSCKIRKYEPDEG